MPQQFFRPLLRHVFEGPRPGAMCVRFSAQAQQLRSRDQALHQPFDRPAGLPVAAFEPPQFAQGLELQFFPSARGLNQAVERGFAQRHQFLAGFPRKLVERALRFFELGQAVFGTAQQFDGGRNLRQFFGLLHGRLHALLQILHQ